MKTTRNNFKVIICIIFVNLGFSSDIFSQTDPDQTKSNFWKNVRFGGGIGLGTSNGFFSASLSPTAIYQFNEDVALGLGLNGTYNRRKNVFKSTIIGGSVLALYSPIRSLQLSSEFEELHVSRTYESNLNIADDSYWYPALFMGAGYRTGNITFGIRYDVLYDDNRSIYPEPWIPFVRVFF